MLKTPLLVYKSSAMQNVLDTVNKIAASDVNVLIQGESGTGKELIANLLHALSARKKEAFVTVNCGAIPGELLESELFGHVKGAFTGAVSNRAGRFELADGGTLFLDEIGDLALPLQVKLLRAIQHKTFEPVGATRSIQVDVRVIAATHKNLEQMVKAGTFREDLFYRLNVVPIRIPALRERVEDIPLLLNHYLKIHNIKQKKSVLGFDHQAMTCLMSYAWPGNIRELENFVERTVLLKETGSITLRDLPHHMLESSQAANHWELKPKIPTPAIQPSENQEKWFTISPQVLTSNKIPFHQLVESFENTLLLHALDSTGWNRNRAAQMLGINRTTLVEKIKKKGLNPQQEVLPEMVNTGETPSPHTSRPPEVEIL